MSKKLDTIIFAGLILAIVFTALAHGAVESWSIALFELLIAMLLLLWGVKSVLEKRLTIHLPALAWPLLGLTAFGAIQGIVVINSTGQRQSLSMDVEATRMVTLLLFCLVAACVMIASFLQQRERLQWLMHFLVLYGFALAVFGLLQHFSWNGKMYWIRPVTSAAVSAFGPFINHNHFAGYLEMLAPLPVVLIVTGAVRGEARIFYAFAAAMMGIATIVSLSRGGIISLMAGLAFALVVSLLSESSSRAQRHHSGSSLRLLTSIGAVGGVALAILIGVLWIGADPVLDRLTQGKASGNETSETFQSSRGWIWKDTIRMMSAHPILGVGLGAYQTVYPNYSDHDGSLIVDKAHNDYLHLLAEAGLIGGALALWFAIALFRTVARGLRAHDPLFRAVALGSGAGISAMLVHSIFDFNLQLPSNALLFLLLCATAARASAAVVPVRQTISEKEQAIQLSSATADLNAGVIKGV